MYVCLSPLASLPTVYFLSLSHGLRFFLSFFLLLHLFFLLAVHLHNKFFQLLLRNCYASDGPPKGKRAKKAKEKAKALDDSKNEVKPLDIEPLINRKRKKEVLMDHQTPAHHRLRAKVAEMKRLK